MAVLPSTNSPNGGLNMGVYKFEGKEPVIGEGSYVFETATVVGDVTMGKECYVGPGAVVRGDYGTVRIGDGVAIEENVVIHARPGEITVIGNHVTIGHCAVIHNCTLKDYAVIGMGAVVSDYAEVGVWGVVGEGAVVRNKQQIPDRNICVGIPAKIIGQINDQYEEQWTKFKKIYNDLAANKYPNTLEKIG